MTAAVPAFVDLVGLVGPGETVDVTPRALAALEPTLIAQGWTPPARVPTDTELTHWAHPAKEDAA